MIWLQSPFWLLLIYLSLYDMRTLSVPIFPVKILLWSGLFFNSAFHVMTLSEDAVFGACLGYGMIAGSRCLYRIVRKSEGIGLGDAYVLAAIGSWVGALKVLPILACASFLGLLWSVLRILIIRTLLPDAQRRSHRLMIPFVPFLSIASGLLTQKIVMQWWGFDC